MDNRKNLFFISSLAAIASTIILYLDFMTAGIKKALFGNCSPFYQVVLPIVFTLILWILLSTLLLRVFKNTSLSPFALSNETGKSGNLLCVLIVLCMTVVMTVLNGGIKPLKELEWFLAFGNTLGWIGYLIQNTYYVFEMVLALMIVYFSQTAGEWLTSLPNVPWGSISLAIMWGLPHIFTKNLLTGIFSLLFGLALGLIYLLTGRNGKLTLFYMAVAFIL